MLSFIFTFAVIDFLQRDLDAIVEWANMWQLNISISKTFLLHIGSKNPRHVYSINGTDIVAVDTIKDLGVHVSHDLSWSVNIQEVVKQANKIANVILHAFRYVITLIYICRLFRSM